MNEQAASLAALNVSLLRAIAEGEAASPSDLAQRAGIVANNLSRKLDSLLGAGLIKRAEDAASHEVTLTDDGARGLGMMEYWTGDIAPPSALDTSLVYIPFDSIEPWILNPRTQFDAASIEDMAQSIADKGVLQPLTVRAKGERFEVIIGERRRRGAHLAAARGWVSFDFLVPCQVKDYSDDEALDVAGVENLQRHDLHWMDEAKFYLRLAERGRSGADIARLAGESVSKRKVQDYCKIARELSPRDVERCYLPDTAEGVLLYTKARDLVGEKKERPTLDLSPQLALAFAELTDAATLPEQDFDGTRLVSAILYRAPMGGPLGKLQERKLVTFGFGADKQMEARITLTDEVRQWLAHVGFLADRPAALLKLRAAVVGEMVAATFHPSHWHTAELNAPPPTYLPRDAAGGGPDAEADAPAAERRVEGASHPAEADPLTRTQRRILREIAARSIHKSRFVGDFVSADLSALDDPDYQDVYAAELTSHRREPASLQTAVSRRGEDYLKRFSAMPTEGLSPNSCVTPWLRDDFTPASDDAAAFRAELLEQVADDLGCADDDPDEETPAYLQRLAGVPSEAPTPAPPEPETLPPMLAIVMIEAAHKIGVEGIERGPETWGAPILADFYKDARGQQLVMKRFLAFMPLGERQLVTVAKLGRDWLAQAENIHSAAGRPSVTDAALLDAQRELVGIPAAHTYSTPWLNKPAEAAPPAPPPFTGEGDREAVEGAVEGEVVSPSHEREEADREAAYSPSTAAPSPIEPPRLTAPLRALLACYAQLGQLDSLLARLKDHATQGHKVEIDQHRRLIEAVRETAKASLPEGI